MVGKGSGYWSIGGARRNFWVFGNVLFLDQGDGFMNICFVINQGVVRTGFMYFENIGCTSVSASTANLPQFLNTHNFMSRTFVLTLSSAWKVLPPHLPRTNLVCFYHWGLTSNVPYSVRRCSSASSAPASSLQPHPQHFWLVFTAVLLSSVLVVVVVLLVTVCHPPLE